MTIATSTTVCFSFFLKIDNNNHCKQQMGWFLGISQCGCKSLTVRVFLADLSLMVVSTVPAYLGEAVFLPFHCCPVLIAKTLFRDRHDPSNRPLYHDLIRPLVVRSREGAKVQKKILPPDDGPFHTFHIRSNVYD